MITVIRISKQLKEMPITLYKQNKLIDYSIEKYKSRCALASRAFIAHLVPKWK